MHEKERVALTSVFAAIFLTVTKMLVGILTGSLGIISEAAHSALDLVAAVMTAAAVRISGKPADKTHNYGHGKVENFSALFETLLLLGTCIWIVGKAVQRIASHHYAVEANIWSFAVIVMSITIDINRARMLYRAAHKHNSQALEADALHFSSDIFSSGVVLIGLVFVKLGIPLGDPLAALGVAILIILASIKLGKRTIDALLDTAPPDITRQVREAVLATSGVLDCTMVRARPSGADMFVDVKVTLQPDLHLDSTDTVLRSVEKAVRAVLPAADVMVRPLPASAHWRNIPSGE